MIVEKTYTRTVGGKTETYVKRYKRTKYFSLEDKQEMKELLDMGVKKKNVCEKYGISYGTLKKYMNEISE